MGVAAVQADNAFLNTAVSGLASYLGLTTKRQETDKFQTVKDMTPKVKNFGFNAISKTDHVNPWGVDLGLNFDLGVSYELPLYNVDNYLVTRQRFHTYLGGRQYLTFFLGYFRWHIYFDVWPVKCTFIDNYVQFDIVNYDDYCTASHWYLDITRVQLLTQLDVNECLIGLVGQFTDSTEDCTWSTYYVNHPVFDWDLFYDRLSGEIFPNTCGDIPTYDV